MNTQAQKIVVIGGGSIGKRHLRNLRSIGYGNLFCLHHSAESRAGIKGVRDIYNWYELIDLDPNAVFICTPTVYHIELLKKLSELKCNIFMEKPLGGTQSAPSLVDLSNRHFMIGFMLRWHSQLKWIRDCIQKGTFGTIIGASFEFGSYLPMWHPNEDYKKSYAAISKMGGGVINTISHEADLAIWFFGFPETVYTEYGGSRILDIDAEESCDIIFGYPEFNVTVHLDFLQRLYRRKISIYFEDVTLDWDWNSNKIIVAQDGKKSVEYRLSKSFDVNYLYVDEVKSFFNLCEGECFTHSLDYKYALKNQILLDVMHKSNRMGQRLKLNFNLT